MCIYVVGGYICLCTYMSLVVISVMCIYVVGDYICLCAYMLLVNFSYMLLVVIVGVSKYWNMLMWTCGIGMKYVLLLSSPCSHTVVVGFHLHVGVEYLCIHLRGLLCGLL